MKTSTDQLYNSDSEVFWAEVAPCDHLMQLYDDDDVFLDSLEGFVGGGIRRGDASVVIATPAHRNGLEQRLKKRGIDLNAARENGTYVDLDAEATLAKFMNDGWPDDEKFYSTIADVLTPARHDGRHVRAFGEMVALLWANGHSAATVRLEYLWHNLCQAEVFSLLCSYPKIGFTDDMQASLNEILANHSRLVSSRPQPKYVQ